ncbi:MAG: membrane protein insertase YidC [Desulfobacterales bacterium]|nr:membrane protein insertase YidC [Desulfobacterales bacterium]
MSVWKAAIDFGWFKWLAIPSLFILNFLYGFVLNYGIAIIILTTIIKIIFWPLGNLSYKSMNEMKKLQPKIEALKEKYKNDQSKIGQETMALYREHKVNPFSGCLPMLIQIPVFFGLYKALMYSIELRHSPLFFWIQDLSAKDPYYITPIIMGATQFHFAENDPRHGRSDAAESHAAHAGYLYILLFKFPVRTGHLLAVQQHFTNRSAILY